MHYADDDEAGVCYYTM